jgi:HlyD family secretion protein
MLVACATLTSCQSNKSTEQVPTEVAPRKVSALGRVQPESDIRKVSANGAVSSDRIEEIFVKENQVVKKGDPLARLNSYDSLKAAVEQSVQLVAVAQSTLNQVKAGAKQGEIKAQEFKVETVKR